MQAYLDYGYNVLDDLLLSRDHSVEIMREWLGIKKDLIDGTTSLPSDLMR